MYLDSALDLWPPGHFELRFSLRGSSIQKWSVQPWAFIMYVVNLEMDNLPK